jgi:hypothetical protein
VAAVVQVAAVVAAGEAVQEVEAAPVAIPPILLPAAAQVEDGAEVVQTITTEVVVREVAEARGEAAASALATAAPRNVTHARTVAGVDAAPAANWAWSVCAHPRDNHRTTAALSVAAGSQEIALNPHLV